MSSMKKDKNNMYKQHVSFALTSEVTVFVNRTKGIEDELWYSSDDVDQFKHYSNLYADVFREKINQGSFEGELGDILGLEKLLYGEVFIARRAAVKAAVFEEQAWQRLSREMMLRRGRRLGDVAGQARCAANISLMRLANIAEENSCWARECASMAGLALQSDLRTDRAD
jgi:hypothetical protein